MAWLLLVMVVVAVDVVDLVIVEFKIPRPPL
jgi:hypothetical protein